MDNIQVKNKLINQEIIHFTIDFINLVLNKSATFRVNFYNDKNERIQKCFISLEGDEYYNWGNNDNYITDLICAKFNLELQPKELIIEV